MRKIIQFQDIQDTDTVQGYMVALCDDGTLWTFYKGKWELDKRQIPQHEINLAESK